MVNFFRRRIFRDEEPQPEPVEQAPVTPPDVMDPEEAASLAVSLDDLAALRSEFADVELADLPSYEIIEPEEIEGDGDELEEPAERPGFFSRFNPFRRSLERTRHGFFSQIRELFRRRPTIDEELWDDLEELLITADVGAALSQEILDVVRRRVREQRLHDPRDVQNVLEEELIEILGDEPAPLAKVAPMTTILVIGVNGVGKTTSIAKLAFRLKGEGERLMLAAADTFRAGAVEQLKVWAQRAAVPVIAHQEGADPGAVAFDAIQAGRTRRCSYVIIDTAGRLHTKHNLMEELRKIKRVIQKLDPEAPHEILLVLDAVTGQNAILQAKKFKEAVGLTGIIVTKLDGSAKGGSVFAIKRELDAPIKYIATGETIHDLAPFDARTFVRALFDPDDEDEE